MSSYYAASVADFISVDPDGILGRLTASAGESGFTSLMSSQIFAWRVQIEILQATLKDADLPSEAGVIFEFSIPRRGRRVDTVIICEGVGLLLEFKVGADSFAAADRRQIEEYGLDLRDFHAGSSELTLVPVLVATKASDSTFDFSGAASEVIAVQQVTPRDLPSLVRDIRRTYSADGASAPWKEWESSEYSPTPTIVEAAQYLFAGHDVSEIAHSHAGVENLGKTTEKLVGAIAGAARTDEKVICFVTGVPGSGKTLAGLNVVHNPEISVHGESLSVFLSGNGPLVRVLAEALARDRAARDSSPKKEALRESSAFVQNVHRFLDHYVDDQPESIPAERIVVFDEAQRAWDEAQSKKKFGRPHSEPQMMLEVMSRRPGWTAIVALVGGGQEINTGEAGLSEWGRALSKSGTQWRVYASPDALHGGDTTVGQRLFEDGVPRVVDAVESPSLHLDVSIRSYRAQLVAAWADAVVRGDVNKAYSISASLDEFPIRIARRLSDLRQWLVDSSRGERRYGLIASSGARRLRAEGLDVTVALDEPNWFLAPRGDVRSSFALEVPATEFGIQGLELDWVGLCWGADFRRSNENWVRYAFRGTKWQSVRDPTRQSYVENKYRVLLTRARCGLGIWVPLGDQSDPTRQPAYYQETAEFMIQCGVEEFGSGSL
jgi:hypothetical protein